MDMTPVEETKRHHRKTSSLVESSRRKEERQTKEHLEKRSRARDEGSRGHMRFTGSISTGSREVETDRWWPMLHIWSHKGLSQVSQSFLPPPITHMVASGS